MNENATPCTVAERIIVAAMEKAEQTYTTAMMNESGRLSRLDLCGCYADTLKRLSEALAAISTEGRFLA